MSASEESPKQKGEANVRAAKAVAFLDANRDKIVRMIEERMVTEITRLVEAAARELLSGRGVPNAFMGVSEQVPGAHAFPVDKDAVDNSETSSSSEDSTGNDSETSSSSEDSAGNDSDPSSSES